MMRLEPFIDENKHIRFLDKDKGKRYVRILMSTDYMIDAFDQELKKGCKGCENAELYLEKCKGCKRAKDLSVQPLAVYKDKMVEYAKIIYFNQSPEFIAAGYWYVEESFIGVETMNIWPNKIPQTVSLFMETGEFINIQLFCISNGGKTRSSDIYTSVKEFQNLYMFICGEVNRAKQRKNLEDLNRSYNPFGRLMNCKEDKRMVVTDSSDITTEIDTLLAVKTPILSTFMVDTMNRGYPNLSGSFLGYHVFTKENPVMPVNKLKEFTDQEIASYHQSQKMLACVTNQPKKIVVKELNAKELLLQEGRRGITQGQVMGIEATALAKNMGLEQRFSYEWLHLIAFSMGGPYGIGPQNKDNLVLGTAGANSLMLIYEIQLKRLAMRNNGEDYRVIVSVLTEHTEVGKNLTNTEYQTWYTKKIQYKYSIIDAKTGNKLFKETVCFDPFSTVIPSVLENYLYANYFINKKFPKVVTQMVGESNQAMFTREEEGMNLERKGIRNLTYTNYQTLSPTMLCKTIRQENNLPVDIPDPANAEDTMQDKEGEAFTASTVLLGYEQVPVSGAVLSDGRNIVSASLNQEMMTLADIFEGIEAIPDFVFRNVKVSIDYRESDNPLDDEVVLTGVLRLDNDFLAPLRKALGLGEQVYVEGRLKAFGKDLTSKFKPEELILKGVAGLLIPICEGATIKEAAVVLHFHREVNYVKGTVGWTCDIGLEGKIEITSLSDSPVI
ncbi:MAG TPA: hypothetical protein VHQ24_16590, partial [Lachnospiraceae bacterium]|nr:hypothetical protein [Lachnospiraceae bacterium]